MKRLKIISWFYIVIQCFPFVFLQCTHSKLAFFDFSRTFLKFYKYSSLVILIYYSVDWTHFSIFIISLPFSVIRIESIILFTSSIYALFIATTNSLFCDNFQRIQLLLSYVLGLSLHSLVCLSINRLISLHGQISTVFSVSRLFVICVPLVFLPICTTHFRDE